MIKLPIQIYIASISAALLMSALPMMVLIGGLVGMQLAPEASWATLPISAMVIGTAINTLPSAALIRRIGRQKGFLVGVAIALCANSMAIFALIQESFLLWLVSASMVGMCGSIAAQMRFIVVEYVEVKHIPSALSIMMLGGIIAAFVGPELGAAAADWYITAYVGSFIGLSVLQILAALLILFINTNTDATINLNKKHSSSPSPNSWKLMAIASSVFAYGVMSYVMTATPISMHMHHGFDLESSKTVIQWHIIAMFLPALFMGKVIEYFGDTKILLAGVTCYVLTFALTISGVSFANFSIGLVLLGIGWNMIFTVGSSMIAKYDSENKLQGVHDFWAFSIQGFATLVAGLALGVIGWRGVQISATLVIVPYVLLVFYFASKNKIQS